MLAFAAGDLRTALVVLLMLVFSDSFGLATRAYISTAIIIIIIIRSWLVTRRREDKTIQTAMKIVWDGQKCDFCESCLLVRKNIPFSFQERAG